MKTTMTFKTISLIALVTGVLAMPVLAEAGGGMGQGMGGRHGYAECRTRQRDGRRRTWPRHVF